MSSFDKIVSQAKKKKNRTSSFDNILELSKETNSNNENALMQYLQTQLEDSKVTTQKDTSGWLHSGAFSDGYQFGDVTKTILGTAGDIGVGIFKGFGNVAEGIEDLAFYGAAGLADLFGNDELANRWRATAKENKMEEFFAPAENYLDQASIIGDKGDQVSQAVGNALVMIGTAGAGNIAGLSTTGTTALTTALTGTSSMGSGMSEAYQAGATDEEALKYGVINGVAEAGTELIFGGLGKGANAIGLSKGLSSADDLLAKKISSKIANITAKNLTEFTVKAGAEGLEEVIAGVTSGIGKKLTYMSEEELSKILADENLLDQFIVGSITSGIMQTPGLVKTTSGGRDFISNRTQAEQQVIDAEVESRVQKQQKAGKELSNKEITKIIEQVESDLEKGYISTDTIENTLLSKDNAEIAALQERLAQETDPKARTDIETLIRMNELNKQTNLEKMLENNGLLQESYLEQGRKTQAFEYDTTEKLSEQRKSIYNDAQSLKLNNTNRTHETLDMIAKVAEDRGTKYRIVNSAKLKELGYDERANGLVNEQGEVLINLDSKKALNAVVGHETTHLLEDVQEYETLQKFAIEYAKSKGDYATKLQSLNKLYQGKNANIYNELTSDIIGDYLFTDEQFITNLSTEKPNIFKKIYNYIKHIYKMATVGSIEARQLEQVKYRFDKAYSAIKTQLSNEASNTKYHISESFSNEIDKALKGEISSNNQIKARDYTPKILVDNGVKDLPMLLTQKHLKQIIYTTEEARNLGYRFGEDDHYHGLGKETLISAIDNLDNPKEIYKQGGNNYLIITEITDRNNNKIIVPIKINGKGTYNNMIIDENQILSVYGHKKLEDYLNRNNYVRIYKKNRDTLNEGVISRDIGNSIDNSITSIQSNVNTTNNSMQKPRNNTLPAKKNSKTSKYSISTDNNGRQLTKEQQEYFKNSKARDENGNLVRVYHGTQFGGFTEFSHENPSIGNYRFGDKNVNFFTSNVYMASSYSDSGQFASKIKTPKLSTMEEVHSVIAEKNNDLFEANSIYNPEISYYDRLSIKEENGVINLYDNDKLMHRFKNETDIIRNINSVLRRLYGGGLFGHMEGLYVGYLNITNPYIVDAEGRNWKFIAKEYSQELEGKYNSLTQVEKETLTRIARDNGRIGFSQTLDKAHENSGTEFYNFGYKVSAVDSKNLASAYKKLMEPLDSITPNMKDVFYVAEKNFSKEAIEIYSERELTTNDIVKKAIADGSYDGVIIKNVVDYGSEMSIEKPGDLYITLNSSNQFKDVDNLNPTDDPDIRYSLSEPNADIAPTGSYNVYGKDLKQQVEEVIAPLQETVTELTAQVETLQEQLAPAEQSSMMQELFNWSTESTAETLPNTPQILKETFLDNSMANSIRDRNNAQAVEELRNKQGKLEENLAKAIVRMTEKNVDKKTYQKTIDTYNSKISEMDQEIDKILNRPNYMTDLRYKGVEPQAQEQVEQKPIKEKTRAEILVNEPAVENKRNKRGLSILASNVLDKGLVFENLALKTGNRELQGKWDYTRTAMARAQHVIGEGHTRRGVKLTKSLNEIREEIENTGYTKPFYEYMYHQLNIDRMTLEERYALKNKPVFGEDVTAAQSQEIVKKLETAYPEFKKWAEYVYEYVNADRQQLVDNGVISQETADYWSKMYPHYVPIRRANKNGNAINVPLDTGRTGINAPIKKATGGSSNILPMFDTIAMRTLQTYRATSRNSFGMELMNTIDSVPQRETASIDEVMDSIDTQEELLQEGKNGNKPTFTVFDNGEKVTFEITEDMYDALKPLSDSSILTKRSKILNTASNIRKGILTEYNPIFMATNAMKDAQDVLINSQHPGKTYATLPQAYTELVTKGRWYQEYIENGGEQNSYFDNQSNTFDTERKGIAKVLDMYPLRKISELNNFIEMAPRLAEYIASREAGTSIETAMLDAARVTTNFKAGGDLTKFLNDNGATFLGASVQGAMQQVRNVREAHANGLKGWAGLATRFALASIPAMILNHLLWDDDEEYEELSDYVKQNYYIVAKNEDGTFVRIPKGRAVAVIQEAFNQMGNLITGNDEADLKSFLDLVVNNLAPNNPIDNNIISPIVQAATNKAWYGGDLVPLRLQDLPAAEQYDESTDSFSKWLGELINVSPYKINYVLDQYSGGIGDIVLPTLTPKAENGSDSILGDILAPLNDKFTTNSTLNNQNVTDLYDLSDKLTTEAKKSKATDEDKVKNKYINAVKSEMSELYEQKRNIQNSELLSDSEKYQAALKIQEQINKLAKDALNGYENVTVTESYSKVDNREYYKNNDGEWTKVKDKEASELNDLGMTTSEKTNYFTAKNMINDISDTLESEERKVQIIETVLDSDLSEEQMAYLYDKYYASPEKLDVVVKSGIGMRAYLELEAQGFTADKDSDGDTISGSKKEKIFNYINNSDMDFIQKVILAKMYYTSYDEYNQEIIDYLNNDDSISYSDMEAILKTLDFEVDSDGNIYWD